MDLKVGWISLSYQQMYKEENIVLDRTKTHRIQVNGTKQIFNTFLENVYQFCELWNSSISAFYSRITTLLNISLFDIMKIMKDNYLIDPVDKTTWLEMALDEHQAYIFTITEMYKMFYNKLLNKAYNQVSFAKWEKQEGLGKIGLDYSILSNLLYINELGEYFGIEKPEVEKYIGILKPFFENKDFEGYINKLISYTLVFDPV
ncbi:MAG: hypothetical protein OEY49_11315 [Candidatus Heimdallarchaeota archaeon]|nr:hypothetical protein [Candidatus Heimdallarchaeota archaeon]